MTRLIHILIIPLLILCACVNEEEPDAVSLKPGDKCPSFSVILSDGTPLSSSDLIGHRSMIIFFNTSCPDCRRELPVIQQVYDRLTESGSEAGIICIARAEGRESIEAFWQREGLTLPYSPQHDREIYNLFASSVIPRIYILSPDLTITRCWNDNPLPSAEELLDALL